jgi:hypothetical protein
VHPHTRTPAPSNRLFSNYTSISFQCRIYLEIGKDEDGRVARRGGEVKKGRGGSASAPPKQPGHRSTADEGRAGGRGGARTRGGPRLRGTRRFSISGKGGKQEGAHGGPVWRPRFSSVRRFRGGEEARAAAAAGRGGAARGGGACRSAKPPPPGLGRFRSDFRASWGS